MRRFSFVVLPLILLGTNAFAAEATTPNPNTELRLSAQANLSGAPDIATMSAGVITQKLKASEALKDNSIRMNGVFEALKKAGIDTKDIQTSGINLNPQYVYVENQPPRVTGYQASNNVTVKVRDLKNVGPVIDALVEQGANQINGPTFSIENTDKLLDEARIEAVKKVRNRAELYAKATGMKVLRMTTIDEQANYSPPMPYQMMAMRAEAGMAKDSATPVSSGEVNLSVSVNVTFELAPSVGGIAP